MRYAIKFKNENDMFYKIKRVHDFNGLFYELKRLVNRFSDVSWEALKDV